MFDGVSSEIGLTHKNWNNSQNWTNKQIGLTHKNWTNSQKWPKSV